MALLQAVELVKNYGRRRVVDGVNYDVNPGEVVGLLGPNGAGKTTSFRMTTGQIAPYSGKVIFNDEDVTHLPMYLRARLGMGYLPQETSVFRKLTVEQNILAILEMLPKSRTLGRALTRKERRNRTEEMLEHFGLVRVRKNYAARLSGGEKRRLEIARCLACEPLLILLDEPFTGIDPKTIADIQQIVIALRNQGIGVLLTDHNVREALKITTRSYLIKDGKVRTHGTPEEIIRDPIAIKEYLGAGFNDNVLGVSAPRPAVVHPEPTPASNTPVPARRPELSLHAPEHPKEPQKHASEEAQFQDLVESLKSPEQAEVSYVLIKHGFAAVPALVAALERRDVELRRQALLVLEKILKRPVVFDPYAPETMRKQQLIVIREQLERRAG